MKGKHDADSRAPHIWEVEGKSCHRKMHLLHFKHMELQNIVLPLTWMHLQLEDSKIFFFFLVWTTECIF